MTIHLGLWHLLKQARQDTFIMLLGGGVENGCRESALSLFYHMT